MKKILFLAFLLSTLISANLFAYPAAVVTQNEKASQVGLEILKKGGTAIDAAIATAFALGVAEPQNSGLGGGGFLLYYQAKTGQTHFVDYRETAPLSVAASDYEKNPSLKEKGLTSVGIPGFVAGMELIHKKWGKSDWYGLLQPAVDLAHKGIPVGAILKSKILTKESYNEEFKRIFLKPVQSGKSRLIQTDLAATLQLIQKSKKPSFYRGEISGQILDFSKKEGGNIKAKDLESYRAYLRTPFQLDFENYHVVSSPLPSSGGTGLNILFRKAIVNRLNDAEIYSPVFYALMLKGLKDYFDFREIALADDHSNIIKQTTHFCVMDKEGNIVSMTNTLNSPFGSGLVVPGTGIVLNNEMDDFSLNPRSANKIKGGDRPLSSMAPTIVFKDKKPIIVIGTPGGKTIPQNLFQVLFYRLKKGLPLRQAISHPKIYFDPNDNTVLAESTLPTKIRQALSVEDKVITKDKVGNVQAIEISAQNKISTISDARGEGRGFTY